MVLKMEYLLDDPAIEKTFQELLRVIRPLQNGDVAESMVKRGIRYKMNYGASIVSLRQLAARYSRNHLLALKLWNKQWRETMILATLLDEPDKVTEKQMDYWVKSFENTEIAEQTVMNLLVATPYAFKKASEWCLGKKPVVKVTGLLLMGRLAMTDRTSSDEQFEAFFEVFPPLSKDASLSNVFIRTFTLIGQRSANLNRIALLHARNLKTINSSVANKVADVIIDELESDYIQDLIREKENR